MPDFAFLRSDTSRIVFVPKLFFALLILQLGLSIGVFYLMYYDAPYYTVWPLVNILAYYSATSILVGNSYILVSYLLPGIAIPYLTLLFNIHNLLSWMITTGYTVVLYALHKIYENVTTEEEFLLGDEAGAVYREWLHQRYIPHLCLSAILGGCAGIFGIFVLAIWGICLNQWRVGTGRAGRQEWVELEEL